MCKMFSKKNLFRHRQVLDWAGSAGKQFLSAVVTTVGQIVVGAIVGMIRVAKEQRKQEGHNPF